MPTNFQRRPLTDIVLAALRTGLNWPVGDGRAPTEGGWKGSPNQDGSVFTPYLVLNAGMASVSSGAMADSQSDWRLSYIITGYGVSRTQCEAICDKGRNVLSSLEHDVLPNLGPSDYKVQQVRTETIGAVIRYDQQDPPYWGETDTVTIWISKELT